MPFLIFSASLDQSIGKGGDNSSTYVEFAIDASPTFAGSLFLLKSLGGGAFRRVNGYTKMLNGTIDQAAITGSGLFFAENTAGEVWLSGSCTVGSASLFYTTVA
jgi:hypothetical protein